MKQATAFKKWIEQKDKVEVRGISYFRANTIPFSFIVTNVITITKSKNESDT